MKGTVTTSILRLPCALLLASLFISSCSFFGDPGTVTARAARPNVVVSNHTDEPVYLFVVGQRLAARINWAAHVNGPGVGVGEREYVKYEDIAMDPDKTRVIVYWWHAAIEGGERVAGEIQAIVVRL